MPIYSGLALMAGKLSVLHLGHYSLLERLLEVSKARSLRPSVVTFFPTPSYYFTGNDRLRSVLSLRQKKQELLSLFPEIELKMIKFNSKFGGMEAQEVCQILKKWSVKVVVCGEDFRFGKDRKGGIETLEKSGIKVTVVPAKRCENGGVISTSLIRDFMSQGDFESANPLLVTKYSVTGKVLRGDGIAGAKLGFRTANIPFPTTRFRFKYGVYACEVVSDGKIYKGIMNFGVKPSFKGEELGRPSIMCEVHIFDFAGDLYGKKIAISPLKFIREERKFDSIDALKAQIFSDISNAKKCFTSAEISEPQADCGKLTHIVLSSKQSPLG